MVSLRFFYFVLITATIKCSYSKAAKHYPELSIPEVQAACNSCVLDQESGSCRQGVQVLCQGGYLGQYACSQFLLFNDTVTINTAVERLCLPPDLLITDPWSLARFTLWPVFWLLVIWLLFVLSELFAYKLRNLLKVELDDNKVNKVAGYITEILVTSVALVVLLVKLSWQAIFEDDFVLNSNNLTNELFSSFEGLSLCGYAVTTLYVVELAWNHHNMQTSLKIHHAFSVLFAFICFIVIANVTGDPLPYMRIFTFFLVYAITEQPVFVLMLIYRFQRKRKTLKLLHFLALYYIISRAIILGLEIWASYAAFRDFSKRPPPEEDFPYILLFFIAFIPTLVAVSFVQIVSGRIVWGIVRKQARKANKFAKLVQGASQRFFESTEELLEDGIQKIRGSFSSFRSFRDEEEQEENEQRKTVPSQNSEGSEHVYAHVTLKGKHYKAKRGHDV